MAVLFNKVVNLANKSCKGIKHFTTKYLPELLTGTGLFLWGASSVYAVAVTPKAIKAIDEAKKEQNVDKLEPIECIKTAGKYYIAPIAGAVTGSICIIESTSKSKRRYIALASAYQLADETLRTYKDKVVETIGEKKEKQIQSAIAQDNVDKYPPNEKTIIITNEGNTLFRESLTGQYFRGDINRIRSKAIDIANQELNEGYIGVDEWLSCINLNGNKLTESLGWSGSDQFKIVKIDLHPVTAHEYNDEPCHEIRYDPDPISDYDIYIK